MHPDLQKSIILASIVVIFGGLYLSSYFDIQGSMRSNIYLFLILISCSFIAFLQTRKIKKWEKENKTDYTFIYWSYFYLTLSLVLYCIYMIMTRSEKECIRLVHVCMKGAGLKMADLAVRGFKKTKGRLVGGDYDEYSENKMVYGGEGDSAAQEVEGDSEGVNSYHNDNESNWKGKIKKGLDVYKRIWKAMLFMK